MEDTGMEVSAEASQMNFFQRLTGVFFEPARTFEDINRKPTWFVIFLIMSVLGVAVLYVALGRINSEAAIRQRLEAQKMSEEQINAAIAIQQRPIVRYATLIATPIVQLITYLIMAGIFLLVFVIMGAPLTFKKTLSVTLWGLAPPAIIKTILALVLIYVKNPETIDMNAGVVMSNLGPLVDAKAHPSLASLLSSIDLFSLWGIVLLSIGFAAISGRKLTAKKAAVGVVILWLIYVLGKTGLRSLFHF